MKTQIFCTFPGTRTKAQYMPSIIFLPLETHALHMEYTQ